MSNHRLSHITRLEAYLIVKPTLITNQSTTGQTTNIKTKVSNHYYKGLHSLTIQHHSL